MIASIPLVEHLITSEVKRRFHQHIILEPLTKDGVPHVVPTVLHIDTQRFGFGLTHDSGILMSAAHRHKRAHGRIYAAEEIGSVPCGCESSYTAAASSGDSTVVGVSRQVDDLTFLRLHAFHARQHFLLKETGKGIIGRVKLLAAVVAYHLSVLVIHHAGVDEHAHGHGHLARGYQVVHHGGGVIEDAIHAHQ